jgi:hypothetical protein
MAGGKAISQVIIDEFGFQFTITSFGSELSKTQEMNIVGITCTPVQIF